MQLFKVTEIDWDCDDDAHTVEQRAACAEALGLPSEVYVYCEDEAAVADMLSDDYGWCVRSLNVLAVLEPKCIEFS